MHFHDSKLKFAKALLFRSFHKNEALTAFYCFIFIFGRAYGSKRSRGYHSIWHSLQMNGMRVPMTVIDQLVRELDSAEVQERKAHPLKRRRTYQNAGPDHFCHYDGHDKFKPHGLTARAHGCIDGWSRLPISYLWHLPRIYQANSIILFGSS